MKTYEKHGENSIEWNQHRDAAEDLIWACSPKNSSEENTKLSNLKKSLAKNLKIGLRLIDYTAIDNRIRVSEVIKTLRDVEYQHIEPDDYELLSKEKASTIAKSASAAKNAIEQQKQKYQGLADEFKIEACNLPLGSWVNYRDLHSDMEVRCKLTKRKTNGNLVFSNRLGMTILEKSTQGFAHDLQNKQVTVLTKKPFFDRIMSKVTGRNK